VKIVIASTPGQEKEIVGLVRYVYSSIFPLYFTDNEISQFERLKVLNTSEGKLEEMGTLKNAFQVMTSMQTIISILESSVLDEQYADLFNKNAAILQEFGLFFPFEFDQFAEARSFKNPILSIYRKADNELLI